MIRNKIEESSAAIICFQETKRGEIDMSFIRNFVPKIFDQFAYVSSEGASGGLLVIWIGNMFLGQLVQQEIFGKVIHFTSKHSLE